MDSVVQLPKVHKLKVFQRVIAFPLVRAKKLVIVEDAPSAPLRREDKHPRMLMVLGLMENSFDGTYNEKSSH